MQFHLDRWRTYQPGTILYPKFKKKSKKFKCFQNHNFVSRIFLNAGLVALPTASAAVLSVPGSAIKATNANWRKLHQQLIAIAGKNASASQQLPVIKATDMMYWQNWLAKPQIWLKIQIRAVKVSSCFWFKLLADNSTNKETDTGPLRGKYFYCFLTFPVDF